MDCGKISAGFTGGSCDGKLPIGGTGSKIILINYEDIDRANSTISSTTGIMSALTLLSGKKGYKYETIENANEASATFEKGTYTANYTHSVTMRVFKRSADAKAWVNAIKDSRLVALVENREGGENKWEVYGWDSGLKMSENTYGTTLTDNVALAPVISSDDTSKESSLPITFFTTDQATTDAAVLALCAD